MSALVLGCAAVDAAFQRQYWEVIFYFIVGVGNASAMGILLRRDLAKSPFSDDQKRGIKTALEHHLSPGQEFPADSFKEVAARPRKKLSPRDEVLSLLSEYAYHNFGPGYRRVLPATLTALAKQIGEMGSFFAYYDVEERLHHALLGHIRQVRGVLLYDRLGRQFTVAIEGEDRSRVVVFHFTKEGAR